MSQKTIVREIKNKNLINKIFVVMFILLFSFNVKALTLNECIKQTFKHHPDIKALLIREHKTRQDTASSLSLYYPQIYFDSEYNITKTFTTQGSAGFDTTQKSPYQIGFTLKQKLYDFGKTSNRVKASEITQNISSLSLEEAKLLIKKQVKLLYASLVLWQNAISIREADLYAKESLYKQAKALKKEGLKTKADEMRFLVEVYKAKETLKYAKSQFQKAKTELELYMGVKLPKKLSLNHKILEKSEVIKNSLSNNVELKILEKNILKSRALYDSVKSEKYGSIDLNASYYKKRDYFHYNSSFVGIQFKIPIFTGNNISSKIQKSKMDIKLSSYELSSKRLKLTNQLQSLLIDLNQVESTIKTKKETIKSAKEINNLIKARYKEGLSTYIEALDANLVYFSSKLALLQAYFDRKNIEYQIEYLNGR